MLLKTDGKQTELNVCTYASKYKNNFRKSILIAEIHSTIY